ncbi:PA2169 family four-helix-bundle protein [Cereibacter sphaeroides]|uniref:ferritin-like domain-containing protein n=1 Tax=Cereibacter sphaeroides TaxID=1063 RepID=UPI001F2F717B|nr:PA2169 family four-helix-bundle protein [Cereibacter sphaeroides]MCE6949717.1 PA2169 family four-helix-bundle protein [Cereibacter sphaeroides]MCE6957708.1 PA2169 family four-helix-bundle protein [Cereibacter sphaeroides]MCE6967266.1 PA2169 family four-helix-bundle protein [Cereibacter sphaeroides]MCE6971473.1 PA2169 family four-helix-bundle protein [Cereibacter sphaeroides]
MTDQSHAQEKATDALAALHDRTIDVLAGFETMVDKAEPDFRPLAERFRGLHQRHAGQIAALLAAAGREADADGTFMSTVNRAVVSMRSLVDDIDEDILKQVESGEQHVVDAFDEALAQPQSPEAKGRLAEMRQELVSLLGEARAWRG